MIATAAFFRFSMWLKSESLGRYEWPLHINPVCNFMQTEVVIINQGQQKSHDIEISILAATTVRPQNNLIVSLAILSDKFL